MNPIRWTWIKFVVSLSDLEPSLRSAALMSNAAAVKVAEIHGRGRALIASRSIRAGELILSDSPLLLYPAAAAAAATSSCSRCFRTVLSEPLRCSSCSGDALFCSPLCLSEALSSSHSPWACQTLSRLRSLSLDPDLLNQAHFLIAAYALPAPDFQRLLSLQGSDAPEAPALHSLLSSLSPPPPLPGFPFSPALTSALLAKDKMNAFGLMEPFRQEDAAHRTVRAYGIYPNASFFNHDCLPNACRFDYVHAAGDRNTEISIRAIHDIPEGRELCISYFPVNWSYPERQRRLLEDYGFHCVCDRCEVEKNWKDDEDDEGMETMEEEDEQVMEADSGGEGADADFPHAYFFIRYVCERENCGGTLAPLPPLPQGPPSHIMECNVCGLLKKDEDADGEDGEMLDQ